ncbi:transcription elongation factor Spt5 [archaeon]|jgi:transcription termination/antitermination protein NusG|nr:transcription elongation factor Spt5 [archaeon]MBT4397318.1 transcription elongation factor Spt5 [archaeon]MBT4440698.1 transcription elongation factor Spt5 [archaeon]
MEEEVKEEIKVEEVKNKIYALRTTANREDQVVDFLSSNVEKKKLDVYAIVRPHGMRGYIFVEAKDRQIAEEAYYGIPYAKGLLSKPVEYKEIEPMIEQVKIEMNIQKSDIVEIISGPFKREKAKITRIDQQKEEVIVELLETAVPIPITLKMDSVKVIRRESDEENDEI